MPIQNNHHSLTYISLPLYRGDILYSEVRRFRRWRPDLDPGGSPKLVHVIKSHAYVAGGQREGQQDMDRLMDQRNE